MSVKSFIINSENKINEKGELVCDKPFPSMPIYFWNDQDNRKYLDAYFSKGANFWKHGDFIKINNTGSVIIYGRSDATLNPGGVRIGTSEIYKIVEAVNIISDSLAISYFDKDNNETIVLCVKLLEGNMLTEELTANIKLKLRNDASPRHVPQYIYKVKDIPYTINGKKVEIIIKNILNSYDVTNEDSLSNPECLEEYYTIKENIENR